MNYHPNAYRVFASDLAAERQSIINSEDYIYFVTAEQVKQMKMDDYFKGGSLLAEINGEPRRPNRGKRIPLGYYRRLIEKMLAERAAEPDIEEPVVEEPVKAIETEYKPVEESEIEGPTREWYRIERHVYIFDPHPDFTEADLTDGVRPLYFNTYPPEWRTISFCSSLKMAENHLQHYRCSKNSYSKIRDSKVRVRYRISAY